MDNRLAEYARLIVRVGVNLQKGQILVLSCPVECAAFGRLVAKEAYEAGAREVAVRWNDDALTRMRYLNAEDSVFDKMPEWLKTFYYEYGDQNAALVVLSSRDPENLKDVPPDRIHRDMVAQHTELKDFMDRQLNAEFPWCGVAIPSHAWASKVFPGIPSEEAIAKLWEAILSAVRVTGDGTAVKRWEDHLALLDARANKMNEYRFTHLNYRNSLWTDLCVELPEGHIWMAGGEKTKDGVYFVANMPTEEIFTVPKKDGANGVLYSSMPFALSGNLVNGIKFTFKDGKIVEASATEGQGHLLKSLDTDEGSRYLGEVALVPSSSLISQQGILYYNTLFDENASCHFAYGKAYPTLENAATMTAEELEACGVNDSMIHEDFMIGTPDLSITGITADGREIPVFADGDFAF